VSVTPAYAEGPTGHDKHGCAAAGQNPHWTLSSIIYIDQTGDGVTSAAQRAFNLQLINPAIGYQASCMAVSNPDFTSPEGEVLPLICAGNEFGSLGAGRYSIATSATWEPAASRYSVNQSWYCDDAGPAVP